MISSDDARMIRHLPRVEQQTARGHCAVADCTTVPVHALYVAVLPVAGDEVVIRYKTPHRVCKGHRASPPQARECLRLAEMGLLWSVLRSEVGLEHGRLRIEALDAT